MRIFKRMQTKPLKVWVQKELFPSNGRVFHDNYMSLFKRLGVVEEVVAFVKCGKWQHIRRGVRGYKLKIK